MLLICGNSKKIVSLIQIVLGPLISVLTGVCNKKSVNKHRLPTFVLSIIRCPESWVSFYSQYNWSLHVFTTSAGRKYEAGHFCCQSIGFPLSLISSYGNPTSMCQIWVLLQDQLQMLNQRKFAVLARDVPRLSPNETIMDFVDSYFRALYFLQINGCDRLHIGTSTLESWYI